MKFEIERTPEYERDFESLSRTDRSDVASRSERLVHSFQKDRKAFLARAYRPAKPKLAGNLTSTVWVLRLNPRIRLLFAYDEDPLRETTTLMLLRLFTHELLNGDYLKAASEFHRAHDLEVLS